MLKYLWKFFGDVNLAIWLLLAISLNLVVGSQYMKLFPKIFSQLNYLRFQDWAGNHAWPESWWLWSLMFLFVLFGLNTVVCTTDRLISLVRRRREYGCAAFALLVSPSLMHLCFLVVIAGHGISLFYVEARSAPVTPGARLSLEPVEVMAKEQITTYWDAPKLKGIARQNRVPLLLTTPAGTINSEVATLEPVFVNGISIHLNTAGKAKPGEAPRLKLVVKRDPGLYAILAGNGLICLLMLLYFPVALKNRNGG